MGFYAPRSFLTQRSGRIHFLCAPSFFLTLGAWGHGFLRAQNIFDTAVWAHKLLTRPEFVFLHWGLGGMGFYAPRICLTQRSGRINILCAQVVFFYTGVLGARVSMCPEVFRHSGLGA